MVLRIHVAMWRVCDAETWIGDGVGDEYSVLSLSKRAFEAPRDVGFLKLIRGFIAAQTIVPPPTQRPFFGTGRMRSITRHRSLARKRPRDTTTLHAAHPSALT